MKKAAMFGLDARIALAIFGALSVISGAALYSAIGEAKVVAVVTEAEEILKAMDSYYLDTGTIPSRLDYLLSKPSISGGLPGWNGPYIQHEKSVSSLFSKVLDNTSINTSKVDSEAKSCGAGESCTQGLYYVITTKTDDRPQIINDIGDFLGVGNYYKVSANLGSAEGVSRYHYIYMKGHIPIPN